MSSTSQTVVALSGFGIDRNGWARDSLCARDGGGLDRTWRRRFGGGPVRCECHDGQAEHDDGDDTDGADDRHEPPTGSERNSEPGENATECSGARRS